MQPAPAGSAAAAKHTTLRTRFTDNAAYAAIRAAAAAMQIAGIDRTTRVMRGLGATFGSLPFNAERLERAKANLQWCFPDWSEQQRHDCAVEAYRHLFSLAPEVAAAPRLITSDAYAARIEVGGLTEALRELLTDRPAILVTGHVGNWEILGATLANLGVPIAALYRPLDMKPLDDWLRRTRAARGLELIDKFGAAQRLPELMERGTAVAFVADQNAGDRGLFVPYFDRLASAYKAIGFSAIRYNAPVLCGMAVRLTGGPNKDTSGDTPSDQHIGSPNHHFRYRLEVTDVIRPEDWADQPDPLFYVTARYRRAIEAMVRRAPEQYLWMHRYWKSRPRFERREEPFPDRLRAKIAELPWMTDDRVERIVERSAADAHDFHERRAKKRRKLYAGV